MSEPMNKDEKTGFTGLSHEVTTLSQRVGTVETNVQTLLTNDASNQQTLGRVIEGVASLSDTVKDMAVKLDTARTRKPEMGAMASVAGVIIIILTLVMAPVYREMSRQGKIDDIVYKELADRTSLISRSTTRLDHAEQSLTEVECRLLKVEKTRYTPTDAQRDNESLRDEIYRYLEKQ